MKLFDWIDKNGWLNEIPAYGDETLNYRVLDVLSSSRLDGFWSDDISWFPHDDPDADLAGSFSAHYTHIRAFHACRPTDVGSYLRRGLVGQDQSLIERTFRSIYDDVDKDLIERAIAAMAHRGGAEKGKIFFTCDPKTLIEQSGHYLLQGSEYIMGLAARLCQFDPGGEDYRMRLRKTGIPTMFEVAIPVSHIQHYQLLALMKSMIAAWAYHHIAPDDDSGDEMGFVLHQDLDPQNILSHRHPDRIPDPHFYRQRVKSSKTSCDYCTAQEV